jgi:hypothetical protein
MGWQLLAEQVFPGRDLYGLRVRPWAQSRAQTA